MSGVHAGYTDADNSRPCLNESIYQEQDDRNASTVVFEDSSNPYGYCEQGNSFGFKIKGVYYPKSDFSLRLVHFVEAKNSSKQLTGYTCIVTREVDNESRYLLTMISCSYNKQL